MLRIGKTLCALVVGGSLSLLATPAHAGWNFNCDHGFWNDHSHHDKDGDRDKGDKGDKGDKDGGSSKAVPEIDPAGMGTLFALVGGGIALVTARRRQSAK